MKRSLFGEDCPEDQAASFAFWRLRRLAAFSGRVPRGSPAADPPACLSACRIELCRMISTLVIDPADPSCRVLLQPAKILRTYRLEDPMPGELF